MKSIFAVLLLSLLAFRTAEEPVKKYTISYTVNDWNYKVRTLELTINAIKASDMPAKFAMPLTDSLSIWHDDIIRQVQAQMPKDSTKPKK